MKKDRNSLKRVKVFQVVFGMIGFLGAGFLIAGVFKWDEISAYFTDLDHVTNTFTTGKVEIDLEEPAWPGDQTNLVPGDIITKNPQITSKAGTPSFVYLQVNVPVANVTMINEDGTKTEKKEHQLLTYGCGETADTIEGEEVALDSRFGLEANINRNTEDSWTLVKSEELEAEADTQISHYHVYTYAYNKVLLEGETTKPLFEKVRLLNMLEGELDESSLTMPIKAFAIQAAHTGNDSDEADVGNDYPIEPADVQREARFAFEKYLNQKEGEENTDSDEEISTQEDIV